MPKPEKVERVAELKARIDPRNDYVPVRLGPLNAQTRWVLERAGAR